MQLHVVSLPHTQTTEKYSWCAYTQKVKKFCGMMTARGYEVYLYAGYENEASCKELITCAETELPNGVIPEFSAGNEHFGPFNARAIAAIQERVEAQDVICLIGGRAQEPIRAAFTNHLVCEFGIGYSGIMPDTFHVFESYAWMHSVYGSLVSDAHNLDGRFYDTVIPNFFDLEEFPAEKMKRSQKRSYLLYMGRLIERKGVQIALDVAEATGLPLHVAGAGNYPLPDSVTYHGVVQPEERASLMGGAIALLAPTLYVEPFGGVTIEANLCGTPAITTDWGAFTETIGPEWRCSSLQAFVRATEAAQALEDRQALRESASERFSLEVVGEKYERYLEHLGTLFGRGFYELA